MHGSLTQRQSATFTLRICRVYFAKKIKKFLFKIKLLQATTRMKMRGKVVQCDYTTFHRFFGVFSQIFNVKICQRCHVKFCVFRIEKHIALCVKIADCFKKSGSLTQRQSATFTLRICRAYFAKKIKKFLFKIKLLQAITRMKMSSKVVQLHYTTFLRFFSVFSQIFNVKTSQRCDVKFCIFRIEKHIALCVKIADSFKKSGSLTQRQSATFTLRICRVCVAKKI